MKQENKQNDLKECSFKFRINHYKLTSHTECPDKIINKMLIYEKQHV